MISQIQQTALETKPQIVNLKNQINTSEHTWIVFISPAWPCQCSGKSKLHKSTAENQTHYFFFSNSYLRLESGNVLLPKTEVVSNR